MLDAYHLNKEETDIREARQMTEPVVIQRLFILNETIEEEYLERGIKTEQETKSEEQWSITSCVLSAVISFRNETCSSVINFEVQNSTHLCPL